MRSRWTPAPPGRHRASVPGSRSPRSNGRAEPRPGGLVFLILAGDPRSGDRASWRRGRAVLRDVDKKLAAMSRMAYQVRALQCGAGTVSTGLRPAGRLSRRRLRWPAAGTDLARALHVARAALPRDRSALERSAVRVARPAVVLFAVEPPPADAVTAGEHDALAREASITWVVPGNASALMSPAFAAAAARVLTDHRAVSDEVVHLMRADAADPYPWRWWSAPDP